MKSDPFDKAIIELIQDDLPLESHPFARLSAQTGVSVDKIVDRIERMRSEGVIRRWGAVLRHQQAGYVVNAMVAWKADLGKEDEAGSQMVGFQAISHCYLRKVPPSFPYNLFTMIHARNEKELQGIINDVATKTGLHDYLIIKSLKEFKKASMRYV